MEQKPSKKSGTASTKAKSASKPATKKPTTAKKAPAAKATAKPAPKSAPAKAKSPSVSKTVSKPKSQPQYSALEAKVENARQITETSGNGSSGVTKLKPAWLPIVVGVMAAVFFLVALSGVIFGIVNSNKNTEKTYTINYVLDGGQNSENNAGTHGSNSDFIVNPASKTGYDFGGWYTTPDFSGEPITTIPTGQTGPISLYAKWSIVTYTLSYTLNEGTVATANPTSYTVETETFTLNNPTREYYEFLGWTFEGQTTPLTTVTIEQGTTGDKTFVANWSAISFAITYTLNDGTVAVENPTTYTVETPTFTLNNPTRLGYTFDGWTGSNGTTPQTIISIVQGTTGAKTYTANWTINNYSLVYNLNDGTVSPADANPTSFTVETATFMLVNPTRTGYDFAGWTWEGQTTPQNEVTIALGSTENRTYTANWTAKSYTVTFNVNAPDVANEDNITVTYDAAYTLPNLTRDGYDFVGWFYGLNQIDSEGTWQIDGNRDLVAHWTVIVFSILYVHDGGEYGACPQGYNTEEGRTISTVPTRTGYTFVGWTLEGESTPQMEVTIPVGSTGNKEVAAHWTATTYTIECELDGGEVAESNPESYTIESAAITLINPTRTGYTFAGWTWEGQTTPQTEVTIAAGSTGNRTYTATWTAIEYTIGYTMNGGEVATANPATYTIESETFTLNNPTQTGYEFVGWTGTGLNEATMEVVITTGSTGDRTYTATWTVVSYNITYELAGGSVATANPTTYTIESAAITLNNPTREGYNFAGWTGTGLSEATVDVTIAAGSTGARAYTATWTAKNYTVTFAPAGGSAVDNLQVTYNSPYTLPTTTREGYDFAGWFNGANQVTSGTWTTDSGMELTAHWTAIEYTIGYTMNGGEVATANPSTYTIETPTFTLNNPTQTGYEFVGWTGTGLNEATMEVVITTGSTGDRTYTANFTVINYTITYNLDGGTNHADNPASYTVETATISLSDPTRADYVFLGWTYTGQTTPTKSVTITLGSTGNKTFTANWAVAATVSYVRAGDPNPIVITSEQSYVGANYTIKNDVTYDAGSDSMLVTSWTYGANTYERGASINNLSGDITLTAATTGLIADGDWTSSVSGNIVSLTGYTGSSATPTVPAYVFENDSYYAITRLDSTFDGNTTITGVTFAENPYLTEFWNTVFFGCTSLLSLTMPNTVTTISGDGNDAKGSCHYYDTFDYNYGGECFYKCTSLTSLVLSANLEGELRLELEDFQYGYEGQSILPSLVIPSGVTSIMLGLGNTAVTFAANSQLQTINSLESRGGSIRLPSTFSYQEVGHIVGSSYNGIMSFEDCSGIVLSEQFMAGENSINTLVLASDALFYGCGYAAYVTNIYFDGTAEEWITTLDFGYYDVDVGHVYIRDEDSGTTFAFNGKKYVNLNTIQSVTIPSGTTMIKSRMFGDNITSISIPASVNTVNGSLDSYSSLTTIVFEGENIEDFYYGGSSIQTVYYAGNAEEWEESAMYNYFNDVATVYFYSATRPVSNVGEYWCYIDGVPTTWDNIYTITYNLGGGSVATANPTLYLSTNDGFTLNNPTKTGYEFTGWTGSNGETAQTSVTIPTGSTGDRTYTANWAIINYSITYNEVTGATNSNPASYNILSATFSLSAPTKTDYEFTGWTWDGQATPQQVVTITQGSTGNKEYTANWVQIATVTYLLGMNGVTPVNISATGYEDAAYEGSNYYARYNQIVEDSNHNQYLVTEWVDSTDSTKKYERGDAVAISGDITLIASKFGLIADPELWDCEYGYRLTNWKGNSSTVIIPSYTYYENEEGYVAITEMYSTFGNATNKETITSIKFNQDNIVTDSGINISNESNITTLYGYVFYECSNLESLIMPNTVTSIDESMFSSCSSLETLELSAGLTEISLDLRDTKVSSLVIPRGVTSISTLVVPATAITFEAGSQLESVYSLDSYESASSIIFPSSLTGRINDGSGLIVYNSFGTLSFENCSDIILDGYIFDECYVENCYLPATCKLGHMEQMGFGNLYFNGTLNEFIAALDYEPIDNEENGWLDYSFSHIFIRDDVNGTVNSFNGYKYINTKTLSNIVIPEGTTILRHSLVGSEDQGDAKLVSVTIPSTVTTIYDKVFNDCKKLVQIRNLSDATFELPSNPDLEVVTDNSAFTNTIQIEGNYVTYTDTNTSIKYLMGLDNTNVTAIDDLDTYGITAIYKYAFYNNKTLISIVIPNTVTSIGECAFDECMTLTSIVIPNTITESFSITGCPKLVQIRNLSTAYVYSENNPDQEKKTNNTPFTNTLQIEGNYITYTVGATKYLMGVVNTNVTTINDLDSYGITAIYQCAFYGNETLISIDIPSTVTIIGKSAFRKCTNLATVNFASDSQLQTIDEYAFWGCPSLTYITIPGTVTTINCAFDADPIIITAVYYGGADENAWNNISITYTTWPGDAIVYYYSVTEPTTEGNFWHYVNDVPTAWPAYNQPDE